MNVHELKVISNEQISERYWHLVVDAKEMNANIEPGQFFHIHCGDNSLPFLRRPLSIFKINETSKTLEFLYVIKGIGTNKMTEITRGEKINMLGPLGKGFRLEREWKTILLLSRGVGVATLAALVHKAVQQNIHCFVIVSARNKDDLLATEGLREYGATVYTVTEEEKTSDVANVRRIINEITKTNEIDAGFTCGSNRLAHLMQSSMRAKSIPSQIALEEHMGCALGVCYACVCTIKHGEQIESVRICREGPVFDLAKVVLM